jgi:hypothetical protein
MSGLAENIPKGDGETDERARAQAEFLQALRNARSRRAGPREAAEAALDVGHENRHAGGGKIFGERLQRDRFSGAGGAGDEVVAVVRSRVEKDRRVAKREENVALIPTAKKRAAR